MKMYISFINTIFNERVIKKIKLLWNQTSTKCDYVTVK